MKRRITPRQLLLLGANFVALLLLVQLWTDRGESLRAEGSSAESVPGIEEPVAPDAPAAASPALLAPEARPVVAPPVAMLDEALGARIEQHIRSALNTAKKLSKGKANASNCRVAVSVLDPGGQELLARQSSLPLRPASNMKLVTSAAALVALGVDWNFETRFDSSAAIVAGVLEGDLIVRAAGDPFFDPAGSGRVLQLLQPAARALRAAGIRELRGDLVLDEGSFLVPGPAPGWPPSNQYWQEHCALAAGLTANASCLTAVVVPRAVGSLALSEVRPSLGGLQRSGSVKTVAARSRLDIAVGATTSKATLRGVIPASAHSWSQRFSHPDPVGLFGSVMLEALEHEGIRVRGKIRRQRKAPGTRTLAVLRTPLVAVLDPINAESNNAVADQLFYALGDAVHEDGTRAGAARAVHDALHKLGVSPDGLVQVDGSGLSRDNRVTSRQLASLLYAVQASGGRSAQLFRDSLAVAGRKGSLEGRMKGTVAEGHVFAKTGWIRGTSALSGYAQTASGKLLCFSILIEYPDVGGLNTKCWKPLGNAICEELAAWRSPRARVR